jgi:hypothetical protein
VGSAAPRLRLSVVSPCAVLCACVDLVINLDHLFDKVKGSYVASWMLCVPRVHIALTCVSLVVRCSADLARCSPAS